MSNQHHDNDSQSSSSNRLTPKVPPTYSDFTPAQEQIYISFIETINLPSHEVDALYDSIPDTFDGRVIGTDAARELCPEYSSGWEGALLYFRRLRVHQRVVMPKIVLGGRLRRILRIMMLQQLMMMLQLHKILRCVAAHAVYACVGTCTPPSDVSATATTAGTPTSTHATAATTTVPATTSSRASPARCVLSVPPRLRLGPLLLRRGMLLARMEMLMAMMLRSLRLRLRLSLLRL